MENLVKEDISDSKNKDVFKFQLKIKKESVYVLILLALVNWVSHFLYFRRFGLYEDDYSNIPLHFDQNFTELMQFIIFRLTHWLQGHPLSFMPGLFTFVGKEISEGLSILYVIVFIIITINSFLVYNILKKIFPSSKLFAISGALIFCLFPPDTTKLYLLHGFVAQMAVAYLFISTLLYLNNKKILAYLTIILAIFTYEAPFMVFFGVPFLKGKWDKKFWTEYLKHFIILSSIIALMFLYRKLTGESRVLNASNDMFGVITKVIAGIFIGPVFNIYLFLRAPVSTISYLISSSSVFWWYYNYIYFILGACFLFFLWLFYKLKPDYSSNLGVKSSVGLNPLITEDNIVVNEYFRKIFKIFIAAVILICFGYSVSFTHYPPIELMGRRTSVHIGATFGASIIFACICASVIFISEKFNFKRLAVSVLSIYLALLVGYNTVTQKEFVQSWNFQKSFWKQIINICPDINENTVILLSGSNKLFYYTKYILTLSPQPTSLILGQLFKFPKGWVYPPKVLFIFSNWKNFLSDNGDKLILQLPYIKPAIIQDSNVIFVRTNNNFEFSRIDTTFNLNGKIINTKPKGESTLNLYEKTKLYDFMIKSK